MLGLMADGWIERQILENYPQLSVETLRATFAFAAECTRDERVYAVRGGTSR